MIKAVVVDVMKGHSIRKFNKETVKQIWKIYYTKYGKVSRNTLTVDASGNEVIKWNFRYAQVILYGDVKAQFGYRTIKP